MENSNIAISVLDDAIKAISKCTEYVMDDKTEFLIEELGGCLVEQLELLNKAKEIEVA